MFAKVRIRSSMKASGFCVCVCELRVPISTTNGICRSTNYQFQNSHLCAILLIEINLPLTVHTLHHQCIMLGGTAKIKPWKPRLPIVLEKYYSSSMGEPYDIQLQPQAQPYVLLTSWNIPLPENGVMGNHLKCGLTSPMVRRCSHER